MKLILDLDEKTIENIQGFAEAHGISINEVVMNLVKTHIQRPVDLIDQMGLENIQEFAKIITSYLNEATYDIQALIDSNEENQDDRAMAEVFKRLNQVHIIKGDIITDLYKVYKDYAGGKKMKTITEETLFKGGHML